MYEKAHETIRHHFSIPTGCIRLNMIRRGLQFEIKFPGGRLTRKAPKCSTILRREFGLKGQPAKLLEQYEELLSEYGL